MNTWLNFNFYIMYTTQRILCFVNLGKIKPVHQEKNTLDMIIPIYKILLQNNICSPPIWSRREWVAIYYLLYGIPGDGTRWRLRLSWRNADILILQTQTAVKLYSNVAVLVRRVHHFPQQLKLKKMKKKNLKKKIEKI